VTVRDYDGAEFSNGESAEDFAAAPDAFQRLWTPYRLAYVTQANRDAATGDAAAGETETTESTECPFCVAPGLSDEQALIVARGTHAYVLLNLYPYNSGHLLICPYRHVAEYDEATIDETAEIASLTQRAMIILRATASVHGFNIGMNQGKIAGAGIAGHLHQHLVPRWQFDSNFFPIIAQTKALPRLLGEVRAEIANAWSG